MQFRDDLKTGTKLSALGLGCMRFSRNLGLIDMAKAEALITGAVKAGINYFDTAYLYPGNEEALGTTLAKNGLREKVYIATKLPAALCRGNTGEFERFFNKSLERLRTGYIDYYLLHMLTGMDGWEQLRAWGIEDWIQEKKKGGQIRRIGFSFHGSADEFLKLIDAYDWEFVQIQYNYSNEHFQAGIAGLKRVAEKGLPVIVMEPLLGGKLATGLPKEAARIFREAAAREPGGIRRTLAEWGLRWLWNQREVTVVLSGMNALPQLAENIAIAEDAYPGCLTEADQAVIKRVQESVNAAFRVRCTGCSYCMPCPRHVNIPGCFAAYNTSYAIGYAQGIQQYSTSTAVTSEQTGNAGLCVKCGACEQRCPQRIPIIRSLELVRRRMEPFWYRWAVAAVRNFLGRKRSG
jgi:predicted aldo/keto reductase-like oxidoreductase